MHLNLHHNGNHASDRDHNILAPLYAFTRPVGFLYPMVWQLIESGNATGVNLYTATNCIQLLFNTQMNRKLGIFKDIDNVTLLPDNMKTGPYALRRFDSSAYTDFRQDVSFTLYLSRCPSLLRVLLRRLRCLVLVP
jgi:hypothetical protein